MDGAARAWRESRDQLRELSVRRAAVPLVAFSLLLFARASLRAAPSVLPGSVISVKLAGTVRAAQIEQHEKALFEGYTLPPMRYAVDSYRIRYASTDFDGSPAEATAQLFVPRFPVPTERPLLVFGPGTTGIGDACAPSLEEAEGRRFGVYRENMLAYAGVGFIAVLPDYIGFNDPARPQRYFSKLAEGHVMLDAARAVFRYIQASSHVVRLKRAVFTAGYSQGGHAAFAAADLRGTYAPDVPLAGVIGFGSTNNVEALLREGPCYAPLIFYTYLQMYRAAINPAEYLAERFARTLDSDVNTMCVDQFQAYYSFDGTRVYRPEFHAALYGNHLAEIYPSLAARLEENMSGLGGHMLPALLLQGGADFIITPASQERFVEALRAAGSAVRYRVFRGVPHKGTRQAGFAESIDWMERIARGEAPPTF
jgi:acetyl esterase/lipase